MKTINLENVTVNLNLCDGVTITDQKIAGTTVVDLVKKVMSFTQNAKKVKTASKNPVTFGGEYMNVRLHQGTGASQLTMRLASNIDVKEIRTQLIAEFVNALDSMGN